MARQGSNLEFSLPLVRLEFDEMPRQKRNATRGTSDAEILTASVGRSKTKDGRLLTLGEFKNVFESRLEIYCCFLSGVFVAYVLLWLSII